MWPRYYIRLGSLSFHQRVFRSRKKMITNDSHKSVGNNLRPENGICDILIIFNFIFFIEHTMNAHPYRVELPLLQVEVP